MGPVSLLRNVQRRDTTAVGYKRTGSLSGGNAPHPNAKPAMSGHNGKRTATPAPHTIDVFTRNGETSPQEGRVVGSLYLFAQ